MVMNTLEIKKTVRFATFGNPKTAKSIWIVLHGYGQLPAYFIRKFQQLDPEENFVVAPEGLHRFYLEGTSGRVGASWMTKEAREDDISDNISYLNKLWESLQVNSKFENKLLLGFSQGGATAARWHEMGSYSAQYFVLWASVFPPDLKFDPKNSTFHSSKNYFAIGDDDPYYHHDKKHEMIKMLTPLDFEICSFKGKHDIDSPLLEKIERDVNN